VARYSDNARHVIDEAGAIEERLPQEGLLLYLLHSLMLQPGDAISSGTSLKTPSSGHVLQMGRWHGPAGCTLEDGRRIWQRIRAVCNTPIIQGIQGNCDAARAAAGAYLPANMGTVALELSIR